jgi:hypothetical protein
MTSIIDVSGCRDSRRYHRGWHPISNVDPCIGVCKASTLRLAPKQLRISTREFKNCRGTRLSRRRGRGHSDVVDSQMKESNRSDDDTVQSDAGSSTPVVLSLRRVSWPVELGRRRSESGNSDYWKICRCTIWSATH